MKKLAVILVCFLSACMAAQEASDFQIEEVTIVQRKKGKVKSRTDAFDTERVNTEELCRAACCNLSEAFETSASVDVAYSDAATGAKQIRLMSERHLRAVDSGEYSGRAGLGAELRTGVYTRPVDEQCAGQQRYIVCY